MKIKIFSVLMSLALAVSLFLPDYASAKSVHKSESEESFEILKEKVDPYVVVENNKFKLININELKQQLTKEEYKDVKDSIKSANKELEKVNKSELVVHDNALVLNADDEGEVSTLGWGEGKRGIAFHWWGIEIWLTKTDVRAIIKGGVAGGTTYLGALFGGIGGAVAGAVVAAILSEYVTGIPAKVTYRYFKKPNVVITPQWKYYY
ncbi:hypothetical protein [Aeribacillus alveayuensis]|uniref:Uncharacterized protein n=1 Tax=Aeribacillus alveayuensis TaxID=279215 RepID=A0ABT9VRH1_9BACI|nr:hypothetical protein [Bacillus alveayuensis]